MIGFRLGASLAVVFMTHVPATSIAVTPCVGDRDCEGFCALESGICCADPCDYCSEGEGICVARCIGDCDENGLVEVEDLVSAVGVVIGTQDAARCPALVMPTISFLQKGVLRAMAGCPAPPGFGQRCDESDDQCSDGLCQDGVCCEGECGADGDCNVRGFEGVCIPTNLVD